MHGLTRGEQERWARALLPEVLGWARARRSPSAADPESAALLALAQALRRYDRRRGAGVRAWARGYVRKSLLNDCRDASSLPRARYEALAAGAEPEPWERPPLSLTGLTRGGLDPAPARPPEGGDVAAEVVRREESRRLWTLLALLPPTQREAVRETVLEGRSWSELAGERGITWSAVQSRRKRGLLRLRALLGDW